MDEPGEIDPVLLELAEELSRIHVAVRVLDTKISLALHKLGSSTEELAQLQEAAEQQLKIICRQRFFDRLQKAAEKRDNS